LGKHGGQFTTDLGYKAVPSETGLVRRQVRFYLGADESEAILRCARLEKLWQIQRGNCMDWGDGPEWSETCLLFAEAIRHGHNDVAVKRKDGESDEAYFNRVDSYRKTYGAAIGFHPEETHQHKFDAVLAQKVKGLEQWDRLKEQDARQLGLEEAPPKLSGVTLYQSLDQCAEWIRANKLIRASKPEERKTSKYGKRLAQDIVRLKRGHHDVPIERFDLKAIEAMAKFWKSRPVSMTSANKDKGDAIAIVTVENHLKAIKEFAKWLRRQEWGWKCPEDIKEVCRFDGRDLLFEDEQAELRSGVPTFTLEELCILYKYATAFEKAFMLVGLNMAFAESECNSFRWDELDSQNDRRLVRRIRRKSGVYGEFSVWDATWEAMQWFARQRNSNKQHSWVFLGENGKPLSEQRVYKTWNNLLDRVQGDHPSFRRLSYKFLRKTAAQLMIDQCDADEVTVALFHCRGKPVPLDFHADAYYRRKFKRVVEALDKLCQYLQPMFAQCPDPFIEARKKGGSNISLATIEKIRQLGVQGLTIKDIAAQAGVSKPTVYRHIGQAEQDRPA
jgi:predicted DNA-binding protein (UPF0251 family)